MQRTGDRPGASPGMSGERGLSERGCRSCGQSRASPHRESISSSSNPRGASGPPLISGAQRSVSPDHVRILDFVSSLSRMTPAELRARTKRAVQAAVAAARELGLDVGEPVVLHDVFSVVVHLAPLPVVVRVPVVLPQPLRGAALVARQQREIDVVRWLARRGVAVVAPSSLVPANPIQRDGYSMTFWELAEASEEHVPYGPGDSGRVVKLHAVLRDYPAEGLAFLSPVNAVVPALLESLAATPELISASDLDRARREWEVLEPVLGSRE